MKTGRRIIAGSLPWNDGTGHGINSCFTALASAIVGQAVKDYIKIIRNLWRQPDVEEKRRLLLEKMGIEDFFHSDWFEALFDYDPDKVIWNCQSRAKEQEEAAIRRKNQKKVKELMEKRHREEHIKEDTDK